jgi:hypothetical protein
MASWTIARAVTRGSSVVGVPPVTVDVFCAFTDAASETADRTGGGGGAGPPPAGSTHAADARA